MTGPELLPAPAALGSALTQGVENPESRLFSDGITPKVIWQPPLHVVDLISKSVFMGSWIYAS